MRLFQMSISNLIRYNTFQKQLGRQLNNSFYPKCPSSDCSESSKFPLPPPPPIEEDLSKFPPEIQAFKKKQIFFQRDDGNPVWLKTPGDRILSNATFALSGLGLLMLIHFIYTLMFPKEEEPDKLKK